MQLTAESAPLGRIPQMNNVRSAVMGELRARLFGRARPTVGRYELRDPIGRGSFGTVYRAFDPQLDRHVAIKMLEHSDPDALLAEAQSAARLAHPNIVAVHDVGVLDPSEADLCGAFLVMDLVEGSTLAQWLESNRTPRSILAMFVQVGRGLVAAHQAEIVHRDFKPANVLVNERGRPMVADFGLAAQREGVTTTMGYGSTNTEASATDLVGTPRYMAPELFAGRPADARSDQYAFCLALRESLTGQLLFEDVLPIAARTPARGPLPRWPTACSVPTRWRSIIDRGLEIDPNQRWPTMASLLAELERVSSRRRMSGLVAGGVLGSAVALMAAWQTERGAPCETTAQAVSDRMPWDATATARVRTQFEQVRPDAIDQMWPRVSAALREQSSAWASAAIDNCEATYDRHAQSKTDLAVREACLDEVRAQISSTVDVLASASPQEIGRAVELVAGLPHSGRCDDVAQLARQRRAPVERERMDAVALERTALGHIRVLRRAGRYADAKGVALTSVERAESLGFGPLLAEARVELGLAFDGEAAYDDAERQLRLALDQALIEDAPATATVAASALALVLADAKASTAEAD
ncbi:MAG: serine/threonine protein kinase, partial [Deltaproteobacteria bacterium]|nr:serine/threonine protein kinase [Deltaproteobacteria bacterium]